MSDKARSNSRGRLFAAAFLGATSVIGASCQSLLDDYSLAPTVVEAGARPEPVAPQNTSHLCDIERDRFVVDLDVTSEVQESNLEAYYERANPNFIGHLQEVGDAYQAGSTHRRITYLMGAAGVGKSFVTRNSLNLFFSEMEQCTVVIANLFGDNASRLRFQVESRPDLATLDEKTIFNRLPSAADVSKLTIERLLDAADCYDDAGQLRPMIVIDGLDEIHDESARRLLKSLDEFVLSGAPGAGSFIHFLVAARPEGFATWLSDPARTERHQANVDSFDLAAPKYATKGDLDFRLSGYLTFTDQLETLQAMGDYEQYLSSVTRAVETYPFLTYSTGNLAVGNVVIEHTAPALQETEQRLKEGLLDDIILRNSRSHDRPGNGAKLEKAYLRVLEDIATRYANVSSEGVFAVRSEDSIEAFSDEGVSLGQVRVRNALNRAGIAFLTSAKTATARYRFDPFWVHGHLIERRNQRLDRAYEYSSCE